VRFNAVELAALEERAECRPTLGAPVRAGEECVLRFSVVRRMAGSTALVTI
jgi:hypothetical protein